MKNIALAFLLFLAACQTVPCETKVTRFSAQTIDSMSPQERRNYLTELETDAKLCKRGR
jgi:starvation-inducible outer membrane lipoprotein